MFVIIPVTQFAQPPAIDEAMCRHKRENYPKCDSGERHVTSTGLSLTSPIPVNVPSVLSRTVMDKP